MDPTFSKATKKRKRVVDAAVIDYDAVCYYLELPSSLLCQTCRN